MELAVEEAGPSRASTTVEDAPANTSLGPSAGAAEATGLPSERPDAQRGQEFTNPPADAAATAAAGTPALQHEKDRLKAAAAKLEIGCLLNLAACALAQGEPKQSKAFCQQVLRDNPGHAKALFRLGCAALANDETNLALKTFQRVANARKSHGLKPDPSLQRAMAQAEERLCALRQQRKRSRQALASGADDAGGSGGGQDQDDETPRAPPPPPPTHQQRPPTPQAPAT